MHVPEPGNQKPPGPIDDASSLGNRHPPALSGLCDPVTRHQNCHARPGYACLYVDDADICYCDIVLSLAIQGLRTHAKRKQDQSGYISSHRDSFQGLFLESSVSWRFAASTIMHSTCAERSAVLTGKTSVPLPTSDKSSWRETPIFTSGQASLVSNRWAIDIFNVTRVLKSI